MNRCTYCEYYWVNDLYAGNYYSVPGKPVLYTQAHLYSHNVSQSAPKGYYYENWVAELASAPNFSPLVSRLTGMNSSILISVKLVIQM